MVLQLHELFCLLPEHVDVFFLFRRLYLERHLHIGIFVIVLEEILLPVLMAVHHLLSGRADRIVDAVLCPLRYGCQTRVIYIAVRSIL